MTEPMNNATHSRLSSGLLFGLITAAAGAVVLVGWMLDIPNLKSVLPGFVTMKANTAVGFVLAGVSLVLTGRAARSTLSRRMSQVCAGAMTLLGLLTVSQYLFGMDFGIDQLLFREPAGAVGTLSPGRMAPMTAINFSLLGCALLLAGSRITIRVAQGLALLTGLMGLLPLMGYLYGATMLFGVGHYTQMAVHTASLFIMVSMGVLFLHPAEGIMHTVTSRTIGGWLLRRTVPFVLGVPLVLGWLRIEGERRGFFERELGTAIMMVALMLLLTGLIWWSARALNRVDAVRRQAAAKARESEEYIRAAFYGIGDGVIATDAKGLVTRMNLVAARLTGWSEVEALGRPLNEVFHIVNETRGEAENPVERVLREGTIVGLANHTVLIARDGTERPIADSGAPIRGEQDGIAGVVLVFRDQTHERAATHDLQASETRYRWLFESAKDGILILEADTGKIVDVNPFLIALLGYTHAEFAGKRLWEIGTFKDVAASKEAFLELQAKDYVRYEDLPLQTKDGRRIDVEFVSNVYPVNSTRVIQCNIRDVSERKRAQKTEQAASLETRKLLVETEQSRRALLSIMEDQKRAEEEWRHLQSQLIQSQRLESIGTLAGGVAHEINNPINGITNYAQLIADKLCKEDPLHEYASEIMKETERVTTIVRNLLQFARQEKQSYSPARLIDIVNAVSSLIRTIMQHDQIAIEINVPENLPTIKCRSQQIQQVVMNLLTNARDALNEKYPGHDKDKIILVTAHETADHRRVRITVEDHGTGVVPEMRERIFDPFFTTKPKNKGTGLGLYKLQHYQGSQRRTEHGRRAGPVDPVPRGSAGV